MVARTGWMDTDSNQSAEQGVIDAFVAKYRQMVDDLYHHKTSIDDPQMFYLLG